MNQMENCTVQKIYRTGEHTVIFSIDLASHTHLRDPAVVTASMNDYMARYPKARGWEASITETTLYITVVGTINQM
jgi:predicted alpha/beta hydrolase family esterase